MKPQRRKGRPRHGHPIRWTDGLLGDTVAGAACASVLLIPGATSEPAAAPAPVIAAPVAGPNLAEQNCVESSRALTDLGQAVSDAGGPHGGAVLTAIDAARDRIDLQVQTPSTALGPVLADLGSSLTALREAVLSGTGVDAAMDGLLVQPDELDHRCRAALAPEAPPAGSTRQDPAASAADTPATPVAAVAAT